MYAIGTVLKDPAAEILTEIPADAAMVISAMDMGSPRVDRRALARVAYRVTTAIRLFRDKPGTKPWELFTRDVNRKCLGFVTRHRLPLGYGGVVALVDFNGNPLDVHCTLLRCREATAGWYEGSVYFNRDQPAMELDGQS